MSRVFISYRRADSSSLATLIAVSLKQHNIDAFVDTRSIDGGGPFPDRLRRAIEEADVFVCLLGATTVDSEWVRKEIEHAYNLNKILIPVFQERYVAPDPVPDEHVKALLQSDGVHILDVRNLYVDEAIAQLARIIHGSIPLVSAAEPAQTARTAFSYLPFTLWVVVGFLVLISGLVVLNNLSQNPVDNQSGDNTSPTPDIATDVLSITDRPSSTPTSITPTSSPVLALAHTAVTLNSDWIPYFETFDGVEEMALVPVGCFDMGDAEAGDGGLQCFDEPFWIDRYEVTNAQYRGCVEARECTLPSNTINYDDPLYANHPVVYIDWFQAGEYAAWRSGRLPTEAEWEYTARGPNGLKYPWGNIFDGTRLNFCDVRCVHIGRDGSYDDRYKDTSPIGIYSNGVSWVGVMDLSGNVWEWTSSIWTNPSGLVDNDYEAQPGPNDPRVIRGGAWDGLQFAARTASREFYYPYDEKPSIGFRVLHPAS